VARQSNRSHDRLARRAIGHLREGAPRAAVVNVYLGVFAMGCTLHAQSGPGVFAQPGPGEFIIETFTLGPLTSTGIILFNRE
jgi:hypothetical protein